MTAPIQLAKYVGYKAIREHFGISTRTIQEMVRKGEFPQPVRLPGRVGGPASFRLDEVQDWDERRAAHRRAHLADLAVSDPTKLPPDEVESVFRQAAAILATSASGRTVGSAEIVGLIMRPNEIERRKASAIASRQLGADIARTMEHLLSRLDLMHELEALILMRAFLPPTRGAADDALAGAGFAITMTEDQWQAAGLLILKRLNEGKSLPSDAGAAAEALADAGVLSRGTGVAS